MSEDAIKIINEECTGCTLCVKACPFAAIEMVERPAGSDKKGKLAVIELTKCTLCGACVEACKFDAIEMKKKEAPVKDFEVFVLVLDPGPEDARAPGVGKESQVPEFQLEGLHPL